MYYEIDIDMYILFTTTHQGRHYCLWYLISADQVKVAPSQRGPVEARSKVSITDDHQRFMADGGNIKKAKFFNNAIDLPIFPSIPLIQVKNTSTTKCLYNFYHLDIHMYYKYHQLQIRCTGMPHWTAYQSEFLFGYSTCWRMH